MSGAPYTDITPDQLGTLSADTRLIDVRQPEEFNGPMGHLPGAELVPLATIAAASEGWSREQPLLLICAAGGRSSNAARVLSQKGFKNLYNLVGGMMAVRATTPGR